MTIKRIVTILVFALVGWALCAAVMGIGMGMTIEDNALVIHAIAAPVIFGVLSFVYFKKFNYTPALKTAIIFVLFVIFMDFFVVALLVLKNFEMFKSFLGTWLPFLLIFISTYFVGLRVDRKR